MPISIPTRHRDPLRLLACMDAADRARVAEAISRTPAVVNPDELIARVAADTKLDEKPVSEVVWMLMSMFRGAGRSKGEFVKDVVEAAKDLVENKPVDWNAFSRDLTSLLEDEDSLGMTVKAADVRQDHGHVFCTARILSDIRSVFGRDPAATPWAAAVVHTLRISYHEGGDHREFYVALDARDLREVRNLAERAIKKEVALKAAIQKSGMNYFETEIES